MKLRWKKVLLNKKKSIIVALKLRKILRFKVWIFFKLKKMESSVTSRSWQKSCRRINVKSPIALILLTERIIRTLHPVVPSPSCEKGNSVNLQDYRLSQLRGRTKSHKLTPKKKLLPTPLNLKSPVPQTVSTQLNQTGRATTNNSYVMVI